MGQRAQQTSEDESAPFFFLLALLLCVVAPWTLSVLWHLLTPGRREVRELFPSRTEKGARVRQCQTQAMTIKREAELAKLRSRRRLLTRGFVCRTLILVMLWCWVAYIGVQTRKVTALHAFYQNFDPYQILGVSSGKERHVRKAYHKLSLMYHPDKNPSPNAAAQFILITKAYTALTDPVAKANYLKYGNPDGPMTLEIGVAIPSFSKENQGLVLVLFVLIFVIGVPLAMLCAMSAGGEGQGEKAANGVYRKTMEGLANGLTLSTDLEDALQLLLDSVECASLPTRPGEEAALAAIAEALLPGCFRGRARGRGSKGGGGGPKEKGEVLLLAHLHRRHELVKGPLAADLHDLLRALRAVVLAALTLAVKQGFAEATRAMVELHQCLVQALDPGSEGEDKALLQIPHITVEHLKLWRKGPRKIVDLPAFLALPTEDRMSSVESFGLGVQEALDVDEFAKVARRLSIAKTAVFVQGESNVCQGDVATLEVTLLRGNLEEGEAAGAAHTPLFPSASVPEAWWLILQLPGGRMARAGFERLAGRGREVVARVHFRVPQTGKLRCKLWLKCEAYAGLDISQQVVFEAKRPEEVGSDAAADSGSEKEDADEDAD